MYRIYMQRVNFRREFGGRVREKVGIIYGRPEVFGCDCLQDFAGRYVDRRVDAWYKLDFHDC